MRDTAHLSLIEDAIYRRLLDYYYLHEKPLPENVAYVARMIRASDNIEQVGQMLNEYFQLTKNGWEQKRCNLEIREYGLICERNKANGKQGGRPKKTQRVNSGLPDETQTKANHDPLTINHKETPLADSDKKPSLPAIQFDFSSGEFRNINGQIEVWRKAYPAVDVEFQLGKISAWLISNPKNKKSAYARFINSWLSKAQDQAPTTKQPQQRGLVI